MLRRKTKIPHVTFSISLWGSCSPVFLAKIEGLNLGRAKTIHSLPKINYHRLRRIHHFHVDYNAPCLPPNILLTNVSVFSFDNCIRAR